jgi:hypothetical protein
MKVGLSSRRPDRPMPRQAGAATLAVAVIMLLVVSVLVFHSHTASWLEQRATTNQARAKQAHAAAEAGLEAALAVLNADTGNPNRSNHLVAATSNPLPPSCTAGPAGRFCITNNTVTGSPGNGLTYSVTIGPVGSDVSPFDRLLLTSIGRSDCSNVSDVGTCTGQATIQQVIRVRSILRDASVIPASSASFENVFVAPEATIKSLTTPITKGAFNGSPAGLVWHQGPLTLTSPVGSATNPVLLVVEGDLNVAGGSITGFVYVTGNLTCTGCSNPSIQGAFAVTGTNSNPPVSANPDTAILSLLDNTASRFAKVIGTWRDW